MMSNNFYNNIQKVLTMLFELYGNQMTEIVLNMCIRLRGHTKKMAYNKRLHNQRKLVNTI